jgi:hypothetical protein
MSIPTQFALSLELSRLVPIAPITALTTQALLNFVRACQGSGSDAIVEEDLVSLFGRCRIESSMETVFRAAVTESGWSSNICGSILLRYGPGPTVTRALTESRYLPMIIQCSLLASVHENTSLAQSIRQIFDQRAEHAPNVDDIPSTPNQERLIGLLQACEDQTCGYDWNHLLGIVARELGVPAYRAAEAIPSAVLRGATTMFPIAQSLPEDRNIVIECSTGVCCLVVWAYHLMGMTVLVKSYLDGNIKEVFFGTGSEQIIINDRSNSRGDMQVPSITLLEASNGERLFTIKPDLDEPPLEGLYKVPVKGYGRVAFEFKLSGHPNIVLLISQLVHLSTAMALRLCENVVMESRANSYPTNYEEGGYSGVSPSSDDSDGEDDGVDADDDVEDNADASKVRPGGIADADEKEQSNDVSAKLSLADRNRIINASNLLFNSRDTKLHQIKDYERVYAKSPLTFDMYPLGALRHLLDILYKDKDEEADRLFEGLIPTIRYLSILICALAHVRDLRAASGLPLCTTLNVLEELNLAKELLIWDGKGVILLHEDSWFNAISLLMLGSTREIEPYSTGLVCSRGWCTYLGTFADSDPCFTEQGYVVIEKGVPYRNGVWKHFVVDGPRKRQQPSGPQIVKRAGGSATFQCEPPPFFDRPLIGEGPGSFTVNLRIVTVTGHDAQRNVMRTGY